MAVVKQRRQFVAQNIGVVRANTGAAELARSVGGLADAMIETSFQELKKQARDRGVELAQEASISDLRSINPKTGQPEAFRLPSGLGREAADAYEELIERRYIAQTEQDFKIKAAEIATEYENDPDGVAKFSNEFGNYIETSSVNASPKFENIIRNVGSALLASNKLNLQSKANDRKRQAEYDQIVLDTEDAARTLAIMSGSGSYASGSSSYEDAGKLLDERLKIIDLGVKSQIITGPQAERLRRTLVQGMYKGTAQRIINKIAGIDGVDSMLVNDVRKVIQTGGRDINELPDSIQAEVQNIISDPDFAQYQEAFNSDLTTFQATLSQEETAARQAQTDAERKQAQDEADAAEEARLGLTDIRRTADSEIGNLINNGDIAGAIARLSQLEGVLNIEAGRIGRTGETDAALTRSRQLLITRVINQANQIADTADMKAFTDYVVNEGQVSVDMPDDLRKLADTVVKVADYGLDRASIESESEDYLRDKAAVDSANAEAASTTRARNEMSAKTADPKSTINQRTIENDILPEGAGPDYWFTNEAFQSLPVWSQAIINNGVLPKNLITGMENMINGSIDDESRVAILAQYYATFANVRSAKSDEPINMWSDAGMSSADRGLIEGALYAASMLEGGFQQNFSTVLAKVRAAKDDDVRFQAQMNNFLGEETLDEFINRVTMEDGFFYDKPNANAAFEMRGFVEYQIASGKGKETVESDLKRYFEQQYHPLQGVVIDPAFQQADRSRQALGGRFGKRVPEVVSIMNTMVADLGIDTARFRLDLLTQGTETRRRIRGVAGAEEEVIEGEVTPRPEGIDTELRLMPLPFAGTTAEDVQYITMTINDTGDVVPFVYNDEEGRPQFLYFGLDDLSQRLLEKTN